MRNMKDMKKQADHRSLMYFMFLLSKFPLSFFSR